MGIGTPRQTVAIDNATESAAFELEGPLGFIIVDAVNSGTPTITLQVSDDDADWTDTDITVTGSTSAKQLIYSDTAAKVSGLAGHGPRFRFSASSAITVDVYLYGRLT